MYNKRKITRYIEIHTGFFLILAVMALLVSFLLNFDYTIPNATFEEDLDFLKESYSPQKISAVSWIVAGILYLLLLPSYLILFNRYQKIVHILCSLFIVIMAYSFFNIGLIKLNIATASQNYFNYPILYAELPVSSILPDIRQNMIMHKIGMSALGIFTTLAAVSKLKIKKFSLLGSILTTISGPVIVLYTWINPDHFILTCALAFAWTGLLVIGVRLVNRGLLYKPLAKQEDVHPD